ncbi:hydroxypyruvate isomerase family protein [Deminuibacter soli]|uniref:Hydroxypyruvate isomerase n=1 Tax=Deminuibacter soli TaxID=2291815 RepID=A0A3E1NR65_9BACT|nr:TIM barrel protein [Deminuibacter soli]RFM30413.1 hydroxypyruvate isomerase [Deminuibacter soli]
MGTKQNRRAAIKNIVAGSAAVAVGQTMLSSFSSTSGKSTTLKGNINHAVCRWCYDDFSVEQLCVAAKDMGITGIDLVGPKDWDTLKKHGLFSSMCNGAEISLTEGFNDKQYHPTLLKNYNDHIEYVSKAGYKNLICFSGSRRGMDDETGLKNCAEGLKQLVGLAEKKGVILQMELLNSKVNHKDYMCDRSDWGVELCKRVGSPNFKLLYDIYHMQIDEGDVIRSIQDKHEYFGHYHTGGVPGRNEIDETQELYYPAIMRAIVKTGFKGFVAQEFIPAAKDKMASLRKAIEICDV